MRFIAQCVCGLLSLASATLIILLVLANRAPVALSLHPLPYALELPLYLIMALTFLAGLAVGLSLYLGQRIKSSLIIRRQRRQIAAQQ